MFFFGGFIHSISSIYADKVIRLVYKWLNKNSDLQINKFYFFKLSEKFVEKQKLQSLFVRKDISQVVNILQYILQGNFNEAVLFSLIWVDIELCVKKIYAWVCYYIREKGYLCANMWVDVTRHFISKWNIRTSIYTNNCFCFTFN